MPPDWDPYADLPGALADPMPPHSKVADVANIAGISLFGLSLAELNQILQLITLLLGIVATTITIVIHVRRWLKGRAK